MIALGSDHAGLPLKKEIIALLEEMHLPYHDYGTYTGDSCDYAVFAQRAAKAVVSGECERGILCCGTGIGISIAANKVKGAYAANVDNVYAAKRACLSNNCNIITIGCQTVGNMLAKELISAYLDCEYVYNERSGKKVDAIVAYEQSH